MDGLEVLIEELEDCMHVPYKWAGNSPLEGFDCSGLVCWGLKRIGVIGLRDDFSAQGLLKKFWAYRTPDPVRGSILFFGPSIDDVRHTAVAISSKMMIEAGGGDRTVQTPLDAIKYQALVRRQRISSRKDLLAIVFPDYPFLA